MKLGFSGTRQGMSPQQKDTFFQLVNALEVDKFHHGCCIGSDQDAHLIVRGLPMSVEVVGHPPINESLMAQVRCDYRRPPGSYLKRDADIVRETNELIATPRTCHEIKRGSGTWYTIREAKRQGKRVTIIFPDGSMFIHKARGGGDNMDNSNSRD